MKFTPEENKTFEERYQSEKAEENTAFEARYQAEKANTPPETQEQVVGRETDDRLRRLYQSTNEATTIPFCLSFKS